MTKIFLLMSEENDSHDVGTHLEEIEAFTSRELAESVRENLIGLSRHPPRPWSYGQIGAPWSKHDLEIVEMTLR